MFDFKKVPLAKYSVAEDIINSVTHAVGVPFSVVCLVLILKKLQSGSFGEIAAGVIYCFGMLLMFFGSALYHGLKPSFKKQVARVCDHANIFVMICSCLTAFYVFGLFQADKRLAFVLIAVSWVVGALGVLLTFMDQEKFKKPQLVMYVLLGWTAIIGSRPVYFLSDDCKRAMILIIIGGLLFTVGAILYVIGKKLKYIHSVFHVFVLAGAVVQFVGIYKYLI